MESVTGSELDEALKVVFSCASRIKWRLSATARRRLETDILALCTGMRPVVMVDYGGKMPELQDHLCDVLQLSQKESSILRNLKVMVIDDMIYLLHFGELAKHVRSTLNSETELHFVDLEQDPPKIISLAEQNSVAAEFVSIQRHFSVAFPADRINRNFLPGRGENHVDSGEYNSSEHNSSQSSRFVDLSSCMEESSVTIPTLNGWLLGYPIVYLFGKDHSEDAIYNLSTKSLRLYKLLIYRQDDSGKGTRPAELMSFTVPYDLSKGGKNETWAEIFLARMLTKIEKCKQVWKEVQFEVTDCYPQSVVL